MKDRSFSLDPGDMLLSVTAWIILNGVFSSHFANNVIIQDTNGAGSPHGADGVVQYVLYHGVNGNFTYNQARATCQAIGGDLAKIETSAKKQWIETLGLTSPGLSDTDVWTGLTENVTASAKWVSDCDTPAPSLSTNGSWGLNFRCFVLLSGTFIFDHRSCMETNDFICEVYTVVTATACDVYVTAIASEVPDDSCVPPPATCAYCFCEQAENASTVAEAQAIADEISKNLTVDAKSTSAHRRTLESAEDNRPSAKSVGFVGILMVVIPFAIMIVADVKTMVHGATNIRYLYRGNNLRQK